MKGAPETQTSGAEETAARKVPVGLVLVLCVALAARLALFAAILVRNPERGFFEPDSNRYWVMAGNVAGHGGFSLSTAPPLEPDHSRTPAYPLMLAAVRKLGLGVPWAIVAQILLSCATCLMIVRLAYAVSGHRTAALLAGAIFALDVPSVVMDNLILTETLFTFLLTLSIWLLVAHLKRPERLGLLLGSAVLLGASVLCRPIAVFLPFVLGGVIVLLRPRPLRSAAGRAAAYLAVSLLVVAPWLVRNKVVFGSPFLCTRGQHNLLYNRAAGVYMVTHGASFREAQEALYQEAQSTFEPEAGSAAARAVQLKRHEARLAISLLMQHPLIYARNHVWSVIQILLKPLRSAIDIQLGLSGASTLAAESGEKEPSILSRLLARTSVVTLALVVVQLVMVLVVWALFAYGLWRLWREKNFVGIVILGLLILYFCALSGEPNPSARFRVPIVPFIAVAAGIGLSEALGRVRRKAGQDAQGKEGVRPDDS